MTNNEELLPCPFCGKQPRLLENGKAYCETDALIIPPFIWNTRLLLQPQAAFTPDSHAADGFPFHTQQPQAVPDGLREAALKVSQAYSRLCIARARQDVSLTTDHRSEIAKLEIALSIAVVQGLNKALESAAPQPAPDEKQKQPWPNHNWCVGCNPDNCKGCGNEPRERRKQTGVMVQENPPFEVWERVAFNLSSEFGPEFVQPLEPFAKAFWREMLTVYATPPASVSEDKP